MQRSDQPAQKTKNFNVNIKMQQTSDYSKKSRNMI